MNYLKSFISGFFQRIIFGITPGMDTAAGEMVTLNVDDQNEIQEVWEAINKLRTQHLLCDVVLLVDQQRFPVHKAVLAANSEYFRALFTNGMKETKANEVQISGVNQQMMNLIIEYVYTRKVSLTAESVCTLLPIADTLLMPGLRNACCEFFISQLNHTNCVGIMEFAQRYNLIDLYGKSRKYLLDNFRYVATQSTEFLELDVEMLSNILSDNRLHVKQEEEVYEAIIRWVDYAAKDRIQSVPGLLLTVRLGLVQPSYFLDFIGGHSYIKDNDACTEIIQQAWEILYGVERGMRESSFKFLSPLIQPRIPLDVVFIIGGWSGGAPIGFFETYDPRADRWFSHPSLEDVSPRAYHGLVELGNRIYLVGGFDGTQYYNSIRTFDPLSAKWGEVAPMHVHRCYVSAVALNNQIYSLGGYDGRLRLNVAERYEPSTNQWTLLPPMTSRRSDAGATAFKGKVYVIGGFDGERCLDTIDVFDPLTSEWSLLPQPMMKRRSGVSVICHGGYLYAIGGFDGERRLSSVERFCPESGRWMPSAPMFAARSNFAAVVLDGCIYAIGGFNGSHTIPHVECFDPEVNEWYDVSDMSINRSALKACVISDLANAPDYTYHGHEKRILQNDVSGDAVSEKDLQGSTGVDARSDMVL